jgi:hypothetical protein
MSLLAGGKKVLVFGLLGAAGCLAGWGAGEGFLGFAMPAKGDDAPPPSLVSKPAAPPPLAAAGAPAPKPAELPAAPPPAAPRSAPPAALPAAPPAGSAEPAPPPPELAKRLEREGAKSGDVQISLTWENKNDIDLICVEPSGEVIYFKERKSKTGGELDVDMNVKPESDKPVENIYWPRGKAPLGKYTVYVCFYRNHGFGNPTDYKVNVLNLGQRSEYTGKLTFQESQPTIKVCEFEVKKPEPLLRLAAPPELSVYRSGANRFTIRLARDDFPKPEPVTLKPAGKPDGLAFDEVTVPAEKDSAEIELKASADAVEGVKELHVAAESGPAKAEIPVKVRVLKPPPALRAAAPAGVGVVAAFKSRFTIRLARDNFEGPVTVKLAGDSPGLSLPDVTVPPDKAETEVEVAATADTTEGERDITLRAEGGGVKADVPLRVAVLPPPRALRASAPAEITVVAGKTNQLPVRLARDFIDGPVTLKIEYFKRDVSAKEVTVPADKSEAEFEIAADEDTPESARDLKLIATSGKYKNEILLKVSVVRPPVAAKAGFSWMLVLVIGLWTALLAIGLSLALAGGQNRYLGRPLLTAPQAMLLCAGGLAAGLIAGGLGQALFAMLSRTPAPPELGFLAGWVLLGGLLGRGVGSFMPNLDGMKATLAGIFGGLLGAAAFIGTTQVAGDMLGRLAGAAILGFAIGMMVALVEAAFRKAWLEVVYGPNEVRLVNLGPEPVKIGSDSRACTVWARTAPPVAYRYWVSDGKVVCEDVPTHQTMALIAGDRRRAGNVELIVHTSSDVDATEAPAVKSMELPPELPQTPRSREVPSVPAPPPVQPRPREVVTSVVPPAPVPAPSASKPREVATVQPVPAPAPVAPPQPVAAQPAAPAGDVCPRCKRKAPGKPGQRYCMVCEVTF